MFLPVSASITRSPYLFHPYFAPSSVKSSSSMAVHAQIFTSDMSPMARQPQLQAGIGDVMLITYIFFWRYVPGHTMFSDERRYPQSARLMTLHNVSRTAPFPADAAVSEYHWLYENSACLGISSWAPVHYWRALFSSCICGQREVVHLSPAMLNPAHPVHQLIIIFG